MGKELVYGLVFSALLIVLVEGVPRAALAAADRPWLRRAFGLAGLGLWASGLWLGLVFAPPERDMGEVVRIMYAHVPAVWMGMLGMVINFRCSVLALLKRSPAADAMAEASAEVGLMFGFIGVSLGSIWGRPTWGVWWTWDPRLTTAAIMLVAYAGYLALRRFVDDPDRRTVWSAVAGIAAAVDLPLVYFSVKIWNSLHQVQSTPETIPDPRMKLALRWNAFAFLFLALFFLAHRYRIARAQRAAETALPPEIAPAGAA